MWQAIRGFVICGALLTAVVAAAACADSGGEDGPSQRGVAEPQAVVERFFHWYVSERNLGRDPMAAASLRSNPDVTAAFADSMQVASGNRRDPMLCGAVTPHAFSVGEPEFAGEAARVAVASNDAIAVWDVFLALHDSVWRIDRIVCAVGG